MNITREQLASKPKEIGKLNGESVMECHTKGGFHMIFAVERSGKTKMLGTGSHKAIARHIAKKQEPDLQITELSKSEDLPQWLIDQELPQALKLTEQLRKAELELDSE